MSVGASGPLRTRSGRYCRTVARKIRHSLHVHLLRIYRPLFAFSRNRSSIFSSLGSASWCLHRAHFWSACLSLIFCEFLVDAVYQIASPPPPPPFQLRAWLCDRTELLTALGNTHLIIHLMYHHHHHHTFKDSDLVSSSGLNVTIHKSGIPFSATWCLTIDVGGVDLSIVPRRLIYIRNIMNSARHCYWLCRILPALTVTIATRRVDAQVQEKR
jgi:hypothetical protein